MRGQLRQIEQRLRRVRQRIGQGKLSRLPEALKQHAATGQIPDDPLTAAYVELNQAALAAMEASVSGGDHDAAVEAYQAALGDWQQALKGGAL